MEPAILTRPALISSPALSSRRIEKVRRQEVRLLRVRCIPAKPQEPVDDAVPDLGVRREGSSPAAFHAYERLVSDPEDDHRRIC